MNMTEGNKEMLDCIVEEKVNQYALDARNIALQVCVYIRRCICVLLPVQCGLLVLFLSLRDIM